MIFENWSYHLNNIREFYNNCYINFNNDTDYNNSIILDLYYGYIAAIGEDQVGSLTGDIYYGENSNFWVDYLIEDFIKYGYCLVPIIIEDNRDIPEIESDLDYTKGIKLDTEKELYDFIKNATLPSKKIENIDINMAIRRNSG